MATYSVGVMVFGPQVALTSITSLLVSAVANAMRDTMLFDSTGSALQNMAIVLVIGVALSVAGSGLMSWKER